MSNKICYEQKAKQKLIPKTIQSLQLLPLPVTSLSEFLTSVATGNPLLELDYPAEESKDLNDNTNYEEAEVYYLDSPCFDTQKSGNNKYYDSADCWDRKEPEFDTLVGSLNLQLALCNLSSGEYQIGLEIIGNIDDNGYFVGNLETIACYHGYPLSTTEKLLKKIQTFYPLGVGCRNLSECLLVQIDPTLPDYSLISNIISNDLEDLAYHRFVKVAQKYKISKENVQQVLDYIGTLNPRPGNIFNNGNKYNFIVPDIIIEKNGEEYCISINGQTENLIHINQDYLAYHFKGLLDINCKSYLRNKYYEAKSLIQCLEMRYNMLKAFAVFLIQEQSKFFEEGKSGLIPLTMQQAAEKIGVSISTISRIVQEKYIQTSWGIFPLKYFFSGALPLGNNSEISSRVIKDLIKQLISSENPCTPLTDAKISVMLQEQGICISRRTVAKYRHSLGFEGQKERQRFG